MVAAGTGIAPFRGFLQQRARLAATGSHVGSMLLFFGCRHPDQDFLYREELESLTSGPLKGKLQVFTAFSRVDSGRQYVQDRLREERELVNRTMVVEEAGFYVCGAVKMAKAVEQVVVAAIQKSNDWSDTEAETWRLGRRKAKRWHEDVWG